MRYRKHIKVLAWMVVLCLLPALLTCTALAGEALSGTQYEAFHYNLFDTSDAGVTVKDAEGKDVSYTPPRYEYSYSFMMTVYINSPWFSEIKFKINDEEIKQRGSIDYREAQAKADEIKALLTQVHETERAAAITASKPRVSVICPHCGATTLPDANGCCEYCGSALSV